MRIAKLLDELVGFHAYETGCLDSGVKDDARRAVLVAELRKAMESDGYRKEEAIWFAKNFLTGEAVAHGYGMEDACAFYCWLENDL